MNELSTFNILMYSHDTYGLGHIRRNMAIAEHLRNKNTNILLLTGTPVAAQLKFPRYVDYVRIPGMIKKANDEYFPLTIRIDPVQAMEIRQSIIKAATETFRPDLFIVDKEPQGLKKEVLPALEWIKQNLKNSKTILGLRDIMDDAETVKADWTKKEIYATIERLYTEVWIYGQQDIYDPVKEYEIPEAINQKIHFTGYIPRFVPKWKQAEQLRFKLGIMKNENLITVTTGGGGDGYHVLDSFLKMLEKMKKEKMLPGFQTVLITGPFLSANEKNLILERAQALDVKAFDFFPEMESLVAASDIVVCMGGYNTMCEVLSSRTMSLVIPRESPRKEQYIRARAFKAQHLVEFIPWHQLNEVSLKEKLYFMLKNKNAFKKAGDEFRMTGIEIICERIAEFWNGKNEKNYRCSSLHDFEGISQDI